MKNETKKYKCTWYIRAVFRWYQQYLLICSRDNSKCHFGWNKWQHRTSIKQNDKSINDSEKVQSVVSCSLDSMLDTINQTISEAVTIPESSIKYLPIICLFISMESPTNWAVHHSCRSYWHSYKITTIFQILNSIILQYSVVHSVRVTWKIKRLVFMGIDEWTLNLDYFMKGILFLPVVI